MVFENDFIKDDETRKFQVEGREFEYKLTTAEQENNWLNEYMVVKDGKASQDFTRLNNLKVTNLVGVPYDKETIKNVIGVEKEWKELDIDLRLRFLGKLKPSIFSGIISAISRVDDPDDAVKN